MLTLHSRKVNGKQRSPVGVQLLYSVRACETGVLLGQGATLHAVGVTWVGRGRQKADSQEAQTLRLTSYCSQGCGLHPLERSVRLEGRTVHKFPEESLPRPHTPPP